MAASESRKRKQPTHRKLLRNAKVEMRSEEEGFQGSWHPGTVISVDCKRRRHVQYHHFLNDDGDSLVDVVSVSPILDGIDSGNVDRTCYRGNIRPLPPKIELSKSRLQYGLCVDVFHNDAWWEGVIFDHDDDSEERMIFFPDLGDELKTGIDTLRITQDWDEVTDNWRQRGIWVFLELIQKYKQEWYIAGVSLKQIWYDVRDKEGFEEQIKEWTCPIRDVWEELVVMVIDDNINITVDTLLGFLDLPRCMSPEAEKSQIELDSAGFVSDANLNPFSWSCDQFLKNTKSEVVVPFPDVTKCILPVEDKNRLSCNRVYSRKRIGRFKRRLGTPQMATPNTTS
ncbi:uncharacterized protein LOC133745109 [Rosa rugosa]|uniref:uncharacterized protein LOC133745109 n=1 Tax=Rosa rugosa TaxID=74645 RepID=UPI002B40A106|nr:uncharacterized protein LOC133745109 [Rosa rugosa]XP_062029085.1 uncharacterized protein LOC133745109 [Rosa rugosa]XP_062029086.1 uncharacterized protein LOC133745109 [Rosa rugosa]XP_062029087.1 uncharacterized protein LOC133745109 [Rosa rugosa]